MRKKIKKPKENFLGCISEDDLRNKLFEKSSLVFPEYEMRARKGICKHLTELIASGKYSGDKLAKSDWPRNPQLTKHLENMAKKGFVFFVRGQYKGKIKLNLDKIKRDWLDIDHQKTNDELEKESFNRAQSAANEILDMMKEERNFDITCRLEFLLEELKSGKSEE